MCLQFEPDPINPLIATLKPQSSGPSYSNTAIGTLTVDLVQWGGTGHGCNPPGPLLAVLNVTAHPSTASVPIAVLLYDGPLLCGFSVVIKGLRNWEKQINKKCYTSILENTAQLATHQVINMLIKYASLIP